MAYMYTANGKEYNTTDSLLKKQQNKYKMVCPHCGKLTDRYKRTCAYCKMRL